MYFIKDFRGSKKQIIFANRTQLVDLSITAPFHRLSITCDMPPKKSKAKPNSSRRRQKPKNGGSSGDQRVYGKFRCPDCKRSWESGWAWVRTSRKGKQYVSRPWLRSALHFCIFFLDLICLDGLLK